MRVLFCCVAADGHFLPLIPLARALREAGHDVAFATGAPFRTRVEAAGFEFCPAGLGQDELNARFAPYRAQLDDLPPLERRPFAFTWRFATIDAPAKVDDLREAARAWQPELVVHEPTDLAAPLVATQAGVASAQHSFGRMIPQVCFERAMIEMDALWRRAGLDPQPLCGAFRGPYVDICPSSLQGEQSLPHAVRVERLRPEFPPVADEDPPAWLETLPDRPTVYTTLGTVHNRPDLFRVLLDGAASHDVNVIVTIGRDNDPGDLGPVAPNVRVERYVAQSHVLARAAAVVAHGGSGSVLASLAAGLPSVLVPQGADQFENAMRCAELGTSLALMPDELTATSLHEAVGRVLDEGSFTDRALEIAAEIEALPGPHAVAERLAAT